MIETLSVSKNFSEVIDQGKVKIVQNVIDKWSKIHLIDWRNVPIIRMTFYHSVHWINPSNNIKYSFNSYFDFIFKSDTIRQDNIYSDESLDEVFQIYNLSINETVYEFNSRMENESDFKKLSSSPPSARGLILPLLKSILKDK